MEPQEITTSKKKELAYKLSAVFFSLLFAAIIGEAVLRVIHIPGIEFNNVKFDDLTGYVYYPNTSLIYQNDLHDFVKRKINSIGYLDIEHNQKKANGVYRIGFFGDSYVAARQVPIEDTFIRQIGDQLGKNYETISFGVDGYGPLQSYLTSQKFSKDYGLDMVVYVFCENDIGDSVKDMKEMEIPYPKIVNNKLAVDNSFLQSDYYKSRQSFSVKLMKFFTGRSLLASTIYERLKLLKSQGVKTQLGDEDRKMETKKSDAKKAIPNQNDVPSSWPENYRNKALGLEEAIIQQWKSDAASNHQQFAILYVPREDQMQKPKEAQDSWLKPLSDFAQKNKIMLLDPSQALTQASKDGQKVFYDHFTVAGHKAVTKAFIDWFNSAILLKK